MIQFANWKEGLWLKSRDFTEMNLVKSNFVSWNSHLKKIAICHSKKRPQRQLNCCDSHCEFHKFEVWVLNVGSGKDSKGRRKRFRENHFRTVSGRNFWMMNKVVSLTSEHLAGTGYLPRERLSERVVWKTSRLPNKTTKSKSVTFSLFLRMN